MARTKKKILFYKNILLHFFEKNICFKHIACGYSLVFSYFKMARLTKFNTFPNFSKMYYIFGKCFFFQTHSIWVLPGLVPSRAIRYQGRPLDPKMCLPFCAQKLQVKKNRKLYAQNANLSLLSKTCEIMAIFVQKLIFGWWNVHQFWEFYCRAHLTSLQIVLEPRNPLIKLSNRLKP